MCKCVCSAQRIVEGIQARFWNKKKRFYFYLFFSVEKIGCYLIYGVRICGGVWTSLHCFYSSHIIKFQIWWWSDSRRIKFKWIFDFLTIHMKSIHFNFIPSKTNYHIVIDFGKVSCNIHLILKMFPLCLFHGLFLIFFFIPFYQQYPNQNTSVDFMRWTKFLTIRIPLRFAYANLKILWNERKMREKAN